MSGTSYGTCVLHVAPESFVGGPLAFVRDGDLIELNVPERRLTLHVSEVELADAARGLDGAGRAVSARLRQAARAARAAGGSGVRLRFPAGGGGDPGTGDPLVDNHEGRRSVARRRREGNLGRMEIPTNRFKQGLKEGRTLIGLWAQSGHAAISEVVADAGFDWLLIDGEHAPLEVPTIVDQLRVIEPTGTPAIVRPAWNDPVILKRVLDTGAQTLLVPYVQTAEEARRAVSSARYPPAGTRGVAATIRANRYGRTADYHARANDEICVLVQLETGEAVARLEEIGRVDGVDGLFIGPSDLAASLGHLGQQRASRGARAHHRRVPPRACHRRADRDSRACRSRRPSVSGDGLSVRRGGQRHRGVEERDRCVAREVQVTAQPRRHAGAKRARGETTTNPPRRRASAPRG